MIELLDTEVVVDVDAPYVILGTLVAITEQSLKLQTADVHDLRDSETTRERYIIDSAADGIRTNRDTTYAFGWIKSFAFLHSKIFSCRYSAVDIQFVGVQHFAAAVEYFFSPFAALLFDRTFGTYRAFAPTEPESRRFFRWSLLTACL